MQTQQFRHFQPAPRPAVHRAAQPAQEPSVGAQIAFGVVSGVVDFALYVAAALAAIVFIADVANGVKKAAARDCLADVAACEQAVGVKARG